MDPRLLDMLEDTGDRHLLPVADRVDVDLDRIAQVTVDQHRRGARHLHRGGDIMVELLGPVDHLHAAPAEHVGRPQEHRVADALGDRDRLVTAARDAVGRLPETQALDRSPLSAVRLVQRTRTLGTILQNIVNVILVIVALVWIAGIVAPDALASLTLLTAAIGAGLGFGAQNIVKDVLNGIFIVAVFVIDLQRRKHVHTLNLGPYHRPHGLTVDARGRLYVMSEGHNVLLRFSDPVNRHVPDLAVPSGGYKTHLFALTRDAETAYALNLLSNTVTKIRPNDPTFTPVAMVPGPVPEGNVLSADESLLYVANRGDDTLVAVDTASMTVVARGKTRRDPNRVYRFQAADGQDRLITTNSGEHSLSVFDTGLRELFCLPLPSNPLALSLHPDERAAFISFQDETVRRLNLDTFEFSQTLKTLREPDSSYVWRH